jgi:CheY-like chemotaxis protein/AraC-like DNA-binding protein
VPKNTTIPYSEGDPSPRILIIDDNPRIHRDFELVLLEEPENPELDADEQRIYGLKNNTSTKKPVYTLDHAHSGLEGIEKVKRGMAEDLFYQLAFVDIRMPGLDGVETIKRIWEVDPKIQMVICTAYADYSQEDLVKKLGQTDKLLVLKKPFDSIEVTQLARTLTEKWYLARQAAMKLEQMELLVSQRTRKILELQRQESRSVDELSNSASSPDSMDEKSAEKKLPLILIVERNAATGLQINQILGNEYELIAAEDGQTGLEKAHEIVPDLIVADISMPQIDGVEFCRKLKTAQLTSHIPVILLAVHDAKDYQLKALEAGADDYMTKPFNWSALKARVENLLESRRTLRASFHQSMTLQPRELAVDRADAQFLQRTIAVIEQNLSDFEFDVDALAQRVAVSRRQLFRKLKAVIDTTPKALIRSVRLKRAAQLLSESEMTVTEITFAVGFLDVKHFRSLFKEQFGVLPSAYMSGTARHC